jgi:lactoylglutathione lyase
VSEGVVHELRVALTVEDFDQALRFYREGLGLSVLEAWGDPPRRAVLFDAGRGTLEVISTDQAKFIDDIEVGRRAADRVRLALEVDDSEATAKALVAGGAERLGGPVVTPWSHRNVRVRAPDGMQLTLFSVLDQGSASGSAP